MEIKSYNDFDQCNFKKYSYLANLLENDFGGCLKIWEKKLLGLSCYIISNRLFITFFFFFHSNYE